MDEYPQEADVEELRERLDDLERQVEDGNGSGAGGVLAYSLGSTLAMILSWSRNASILYCIAHGVLSWIYVIYFAFTR